MPIHHSKQFFRNLACPLSELQPLGGSFFFVVAAKISSNIRKKEEKQSHSTFAFFHSIVIVLCIATSVQCALDSHEHLQDPRGTTLNLSSNTAPKS